MARPPPIPSSSSSSSPSSSSSSPSPIAADTRHHPHLYRPWPDLPDDLTEDIIERLPLSDYIRFAAVCTKWRSLQTSHRLRYSPHPPPTLPLPWLISECKQASGSPSSIATCYSPFEQRLYRLRFPQPSRILSSAASTHGWSMILDLNSADDPFYLFNPISNARIQLPTFHFELESVNFAVSSSPPPPNPNCTVLAIVNDCTLFLFRLGARPPYWTPPLPLPPNCPSSISPFGGLIFSQGKFYCCLLEVSDALEMNLLVVDPFTTSVDYLKMDAILWPWVYSQRYLVESSGDLLAVVPLREFSVANPGLETVGFKLFKADIARKVWVEIQCLSDDQVLLLDQNSAYSVAAADVGMQGGNCIIFTDQLVVALEPESDHCRVFDLGTGTVQDVPFLVKVDLFLHLKEKDYYQGRLQWFVPTLLTNYATAI